MIKYNNQITIDLRRSGNWQINTDRGDLYDTAVYEDVSEWWKIQAQTELRGWQKDICIRETADTFGKLELFNIYKKGRGWTQAHDICLMHNVEYQIWVLSTQDNFWICNSDGGNITFDVRDSLGSIMNPNDRKTMYALYDTLKKQFNPNHECRWINY
jgi:hypothetical protein